MRWLYNFVDRVALGPVGVQVWVWSGVNLEEGIGWW